MNLLITSGPSISPIDQVRRITNHSTGRLGTELSHHFSALGHTVQNLCSSTSQFKPISASPNLEFTTNQSLLKLFQEFAASQSVDAIFHAAALSDYQLERISDGHGNTLSASEHKIPSRLGNLTLELIPAPKLLPQLRSLFPHALIVGWKYELDGSRDELIVKGNTQLQECRSDAVVLNGTAWGEGFGLLLKNGDLIYISDRPSLYTNLSSFLETL